jgi:hypothetical protein
VRAAGGVDVERRGAAAGDGIGQLSGLDVADVLLGALAPRAVRRHLDEPPEIGERVLGPRRLGAVGEAKHVVDLAGVDRRHDRILQHGLAIALGALGGLDERIGRPARAVVRGGEQEVDHRLRGRLGRVERRPQRGDRLIELAHRDADLTEPHPDLAPGVARRHGLGEGLLGVTQLAGARLAEAELAVQLGHRPGSLVAALGVRVGGGVVGGAARPVAALEVCVPAYPVGVGLAGQQLDRLVELLDRLRARGGRALGEQLGRRAHQVLVGMALRRDRRVPQVRLAVALGVLVDRRGRVAPGLCVCGPDTDDAEHPECNQRARCHQFGSSVNGGGGSARTCFLRSWSMCSRARG